jgi:hypothetical protein
MTSRFDSIDAVHLFDNNNTNGTWCQEYTEKLVVNSRTFHYNTLQHAVKYSCCFHVLRVIHFSDSMKEQDKNGNNMIYFGKLELSN